MIGEFCAIQGQIETLIQRTARLLLAVSDELIMAILGSTSIRVNCDIWIKICRERINDADLLKVAEQAAARMSRILAHIEYVLKNDPPPSPWLGKF